MKIALNKRSWLRKVLFMLACAVVVAITYFELAHRYNFGHFVSYGLHVDVLSEEVSIGVPGQKKMYGAELSVFARETRGLRLLDDDFGRGTGYPYAVQRWDSSSNGWHTIVEHN